MPRYFAFLGPLLGVQARHPNRTRVVSCPSPPHRRLLSRQAIAFPVPWNVFVLIFPLLLHRAISAATSVESGDNTAPQGPPSSRPSAAASKSSPHPCSSEHAVEERIHGPPVFAFFPMAPPAWTVFWYHPRLGRGCFGTVLLAQAPAVQSCPSMAPSPRYSVHCYGCCTVLLPGRTHRRGIVEYTGVVYCSRRPCAAAFHRRSDADMELTIRAPDICIFGLQRNVYWEPLEGVERDADSWAISAITYALYLLCHYR